MNINEIRSIFSSRTIRKWDGSPPTCDHERERDVDGGREILRDDEVHGIADDLSALEAIAPISPIHRVVTPVEIPRDAHAPRALNVDVKEEILRGFTEDLVIEIEFDPLAAPELRLVDVETGDAEEPANDHIHLDAHFFGEGTQEVFGDDDIIALLRPIGLGDPAAKEPEELGGELGPFIAKIVMLEGIVRMIVEPDAPASRIVDQLLFPADDGLFIPGEDAVGEHLAENKAIFEILGLLTEHQGEKASRGRLVPKRDIREIRDGGHEIRERNGEVNVSAVFSRDVDEEGRADLFAVRIVGVPREPMLEERFSVIRVEDDDGLALEFKVFERIDKAPKLSVEHADLGVVGIHELRAVERGQIVMEVGRVRMEEISPQKEGAPIGS